VEDSMANPNAADARPIFSDEEMEGLFQALGIDGDVHSEADCQRAMTELKAALTDPAREQAVSAALENIAGVQVDSAVDRLAAAGKVTPIRELAPVGADMVLFDDEPSTGRIHNWKGRRRQVAEAFQAHVRRGGTVSTRTSDLWHMNWSKQADWQASWQHFIVRASESLPVPQPSLLAHLKSFMRRDEFRATWLVDNDHLDLAVRHGERNWDVTLLISDNVVFLLVAKDHKTVVEREVARTKPEDFSEALLAAFDGDVTSTHLTLSAVQQAAIPLPYISR
jgi:hypothetical protein